jgi:O-antigen biosynthesis protein
MFSNNQKEYHEIQTFSEEGMDENSSFKKMLRLIENQKSILEFGCATGYFSRLLSARGCEVTGIEINLEAAKISEQYCKQVIVIDLDLASINELLPSQEFDVAVFGDVLEHLRNPWKVLEETRKLLKPNGYVVASIPNIAHGAVRLSLLKGNFNYTNVGLLDDTHLRFFTRETVEELFLKSGYEIDFVDRTKVPIFCNSNLVPQLDENDFPREIIDQVKQDSEADTLQFILRAFPTTTPEGRYTSLDKKYQRMATEFGGLKSEMKHVRAELIQVQGELNQSKVELNQSKNIISSMQNSKFWKVRMRWIKFKQMLGMH